MSDFLLIHGLTYDRRTFDPLRRHLEPQHRVLAVDLPGHGNAPRQNDYPLSALVQTIHDQVLQTGLEAPVVVGHSVGAIIATTYASRYPASRVVNIDQVLLSKQFFAIVRAAEPQLRGPGWRAFWDRMLGGMGIPSLPPEARKLVESAQPRQDQLLGYWDEIFRASDDEIELRLSQELQAIPEYRWITTAEPAAPYLEWLLKQSPRAEVFQLPQGSHFPHLADPASVARLITAS